MLARGLLIAYLVVVAVVVLEPSGGLPTSSIWYLTEALLTRGAPPSVVGYESVEAVTNVLLFVPVTFLGAFAVPRAPWWAWLALAAAGSLGIEVLQAAVLPGRVPALSDVVNNTLGAAVGLLLAGLLRWSWRPRRGAGTSASDGVAGTAPSSARGRAPRPRPGGRSGRAGS